MFNKFLYLLFSLLLLSCTHVEEEEMSNQQVFRYPRETVWEVLVAVLKSYPLKTVDEQKGYIETEVLKADQFWKAPYQRNQDFSGYSSQLIVKMDYRRPDARVFVYKKIYKQRGFISSKEEVLSDLVEENILLYRIARELKIKAFLEKHF